MIKPQNERVRSRNVEKERRGKGCRWGMARWTEWGMMEWDLTDGIVQEELEW